MLTGTTVTAVRAGRQRVRGRDRRRPVAGARGRVWRPGSPAARSRPSPTPSRRSVRSLHAIDYRNPDQLPDGGVLVVGASSSGVQIAEELHRSGRPVTLATGEHVRLPRRYRDRDILWWMDAVGILDER